MCNFLFEYTIEDLKDKQKDITSLFPTFYDRVQAVEDKGGVRLLKKYPSLLHFKLHSGTKNKVWYDGYIKFKELEKFLTAVVQDKSVWNTRKNKVVLSKVAQRLLEEGDVQVLCSCPAQQYFGNNYMLSRPNRDAKYGKAENRPPVIRNPMEHGALCKHSHLLVQTLPKYRITIARWLGKAYGPVMQNIVNDIRAGEKEYKVMEATGAGEVSALSEAEVDKIKDTETPVDVPEDEQFPDEDIQVEAPQDEETEPQEEEDLENKESHIYKNDLWSLNEEGEAPAAATTAATTEDDITYIPGGFKKVISRIKKKKDKAKIKVIETKDGVRIYENSSLFLNIHNNYLEDFAQNMTKALNEVNELGMDNLRRKAKRAVLSSFKKKPFTNVIEKYLLWKKLFPNSRTNTPDSVAVPVPGFDKRARQLSDLAVKANWDDRGALEQIISSSLSGASMAQFEPFGDYDYLYGVSMRSEYEGIEMEYFVLITPDMNIKEQIKVSEEAILDELSDPGVSVSGKTITPKFTSGLFKNSFMVKLKNTIDDLMDT